MYPIYESYKKATNAVVRWVATAAAAAAASGNASGHDGTKWTLSELKSAATTIAKSKTTKVPLRISYALQDAIEARKEITVFYKQRTEIGRAETSTHERFTETYVMLRLAEKGSYYRLILFARLKTIGKVLCRSSKTPAARDRLLETEQPKPLPVTSTNVYESLALFPTDDTNLSFQDPPAAEEKTCESDGEAKHLPAKSPEQTLGLKDDALADVFEIYHVVTVSVPRTARTPISRVAR